MASEGIKNERNVDALQKFAVKLRNALINMNVAGSKLGPEFYLSALTRKVLRNMLTGFLRGIVTEIVTISGFRSGLSSESIHCMMSTNG